MLCFQIAEEIGVNINGDGLLFLKCFKGKSTPDILVLVTFIFPERFTKFP
jgi:hypothetical protein